MKEKISDSMLYVLGTVYHIEGTHDWKGVQKYLNHPNFPERDIQFKEELANSILNETITPEDYSRLTDDESVESETDVKRELTLLWKYIYNNEPVKFANEKV